MVFMMMIMMNYVCLKFAAFYQQKVSTRPNIGYPTDVGDGFGIVRKLPLCLCSSGASIGHRDLVRYFRQKLQPDKRVILYRNSSTVSKVVQHYKALGWTGTTGKKSHLLLMVNVHHDCDSIVCRVCYPASGCSQC